MASYLRASTEVLRANFIITSIKKIMTSKTTRRKGYTMKLSKL